MVIERTKYLDDIEKYKDKHVIKILVGTRRVGKSFILKSFKKLLVEKYVVNEKQIISLDFNDKLIVKKYDWEKIIHYVRKNSIEGKINYLFFDEIQEIKDFKNSLITLLEDPNIKYDIYITGSNSKMLSSELGSELTGRHIDFTILPIDFFSMKKIMSSNQNENEKLAKYSFFGGLGNTVEFYDDEDSLRSLLTTILNDSISKDIFKRHRVKNKTVFEDFLTYVFKNIGQPLSVINTAQYFKSNKISNTDFSTLSTYLKWICEAMLIIKVPYYDVRGKKVLITSSKYYSSDLGLLSTKFGFGSFNFGWRIENLVFLELKNRYDFVYTHKTRNGKEIDFVCLKKNIVVYYQVCCANLREQDVYKREVHEFITDDSFKKIVLTMEQINEYDDNGVEIINILNWLNSKT